MYMSFRMLIMKHLFIHLEIFIYNFQNSNFLVVVEVGKVKTCYLTSHKLPKTL